MIVSYEVYARLRDEKGLSDFFVSKEVGIPAASISDWKSGKSSPKADKLYSLAKFFGVPMEMFMKEARK